MVNRRIFISYRRDDSKYSAHLLYERLVTEFGGGRVFMDICDIPFGVNFRDHLRDQMRDSAVCLALMGPRWLKLLQHRADDPRDFVRIELELAYELGVPVIPVTLDDTPIPRQEELPDSLRPLHLCDINSQAVRGGADLKHDLDRLVAGLSSLLRLEGGSSAAASGRPAVDADPARDLRKRSVALAGVLVFAAVAARHSHLRGPRLRAVQIQYPCN
jgi:hypothetical protein